MAAGVSVLQNLTWFVSCRNETNDPFLTLTILSSSFADHQQSAPSTQPLLIQSSTRLQTVPAVRNLHKPARKRSSKPYSFPSPTTPPPTQQSAYSIFKTTDETPRLISDVKGLLTQIEEQHHSRQAAPAPWVTTAREIITGSDAAQNDHHRKHLAHQTKVQNLCTQLRGVILELACLMAQLERLRRELDGPKLAASKGAHDVFWKATKAAVDVMVEARQDDEDGCALIQKELDMLEVHDPKASAKDG
ncbi:uncharacterized protein BP01DRAFT_386948 [Aspergillus saccharolyticus JOP 1030-1]|uniref:Uncharacterized protein n=1 Tax=Aspergillus saccharolyticus JOP 1030-1 TaxID=1450539 RepID=A0A318Z0M3_9EURO|nr:hypothetical protein BP01DRAFT_386948 [Aspergillus saccharolyticus JOP 1030-1]PYH40841.1 hypothetical protein BP01DRAFT_386948 [Aspergillus saccharolyticus JOP 1030-1]